MKNESYEILFEEKLRGVTHPWRDVLINVKESLAKNSIILKDD